MKITKNCNLLLQGFGEQLVAYQALENWCEQYENFDDYIGNCVHLETAKRASNRLQPVVAEVKSALHPDQPELFTAMDKERIILGRDCANITLSALGILRDGTEDHPLGSFIETMLREVSLNEEATAADHKI